MSKLNFVTMYQLELFFSLEVGHSAGIRHSVSFERLAVEWSFLSFFPHTDTHLQIHLVTFLHQMFTTLSGTYK